MADTSKIWGCTGTSRSIFHAVKDGRALCNSRIRPITERDGKDVLLDRAGVDALGSALCHLKCVEMVRAAEKAEELTIIEPEPAPIPENWLYMAKHANSPSARAWWRKKCGIIDQEN